MTVKKCEAENTLQHWRCARSPEGNRARILALRAPARGAVLTTSTHSSAYWSGREPVRLVVSGNITFT